MCVCVSVSKHYKNFIKLNLTGLGTRQTKNFLLYLVPIKCSPSEESLPIHCRIYYSKEIIEIKEKCFRLVVVTPGISLSHFANLYSG